MRVVVSFLLLLMCSLPICGEDLTNELKSYEDHRKKYDSSFFLKKLQEEGLSDMQRAKLVQILLRDHLVLGKPESIQTFTETYFGEDGVGGEVDLSGVRMAGMISGGPYEDDQEMLTLEVAFGKTVVSTILVFDFSEGIEEFDKKWGSRPLSEVRSRTLDYQFWSQLKGRIVSRTEPRISVKEEFRFKVLLVDGFSNHDWKRNTDQLVEILEKTGHFDVTVSRVPEKGEKRDWNPRFSDYGAVIQTCNNLGNKRDWPDEVKQNLEKYVRGGGGMVVYHAGNNSFADWPAYNEMIGLGWRKKNFGEALEIVADKVIRIPKGEGGNTGHGKRFDASVTRLGEHLIHYGLPVMWKAADLEVYRYARGPAKNLTVLSYAEDPKTKRNFPVDWVVSYGKGRVYVSTYGHLWSGQTKPPGMRCVAFRTILDRALHWVAAAQIPADVPKNFPTNKKISLVDE